MAGTQNKGINEQTGMKEDWTKQMKQKLEGHQMTPPAGLWEDISQQMGLEPKPAPKVTFMRQYYWAAAAVVLALVGFFAIYQFDDNQSQPQLTTHNEPATATQTVDEVQPPVPAEQRTPTIPVHAATSKPILLAHTPITPQQKMNKAETAEVAPQQEVAEISQEVAEASREDAEPQQEVEETRQEVAKNSQKQTYLPDVSQHYTASSKSDDSDKWSIGLSGSNGLLMADNSIQTSSEIAHYADFSNNPDSYANSNNGSFVNPETPTVPDVVYKHHIPVRFGLSLQYHLNDRLSLLSGISYTYLKSDISSQSFNNQSYKQTLSYLGIPIGLSWKVWSSQNFHVYLAGSTLLEKCVDASITDGDISQRPWQWSVNASAGAEYIVMRQLGLYLEPSLGYYFDDNSSLQHYYKEHPLVPSLQFGLRLHLK
jgi:hypothetical protein